MRSHLEWTMVEIKVGRSASENGKKKGNPACSPGSFMLQFKGVSPRLTPTLPEQLQGKFLAYI